MKQSKTLPVFPGLPLASLRSRLKAFAMTFTYFSYNQSFSDVRSVSITGAWETPLLMFKSFVCERLLIDFGYGANIESNKKEEIDSLSVEQ